MDAVKRCPECGADCTDHFHLMGFWELDNQLLDVHHLMVLCYHLQHPGLYSPEGLRDAKLLLVVFLEEGLTPQQVRKRIGKAVDSGTRPYTIKGTAAAHGTYTHPVHWTMTAADVTAAGLENYVARVRAWADSVLDSLRRSQNLD
jgi:hypothetical protein